MKTTFIYSLSDPNTGKVRYIGKANNLKYRLWAHIHEGKHDLRNQHKCNWIKTLLKEEKQPIIDIVEEVPIESWKEAEIYWIAQFKAWGFDLLNKTKGGECGVISENCKIALSKSKRGRPRGFKHSEESKTLIKEKRALQIMTEEHKQKISLKLKNVSKSNEHKKNISEGRKGIKFTQQHIENIQKSKLKNKKSKL
jgi:hypothetical protein